MNKIFLSCNPSSKKKGRVAGVRTVLLRLRLGLLVVINLRLLPIQVQKNIICLEILYFVIEDLQFVWVLRLVPAQVEIVIEAPSSSLSSSSSPPADSCTSSLCLDCSIRRMAFRVKEMSPWKTKVSRLGRLFCCRASSRGKTKFLQEGDTLASKSNIWASSVTLLWLTVSSVN
ncbi:hypothetical protein CPB84DRAFT_1242540 [Gymnopilus junonius]|uniref:Uncharacterized protein n=1 Tax=Gymnopilus junonius TaxID=109634 RepID=A0A9P5TM96_GYMJU|nr:hypothetical protein CPB84DRAFT_1242540 [Gymnopilus junonius]